MLVSPNTRPVTAPPKGPASIAAIITGICTVVSAIGSIEMNPNIENEKIRSSEMQAFTILVMLLLLCFTPNAVKRLANLLG